LAGLPSLRAMIAAVSLIPDMLVYWAALLVPIAAAIIVAAMHEIGHLLAAYVSGFKLKQIKIGPLHLGKRASCGEPYCGDVLSLWLSVLEPRFTGYNDAALRRR